MALVITLVANADYYGPLNNCVSCGGLGMVACRACGGSGTVFIYGMYSACPYCGGRGGGVCPTCRGTGSKQQPQPQQRSNANSGSRPAMEVAHTFQFQHLPIHRQGRHPVGPPLVLAPVVEVPAAALVAVVKAATMSTPARTPARVTKRGPVVAHVAAAARAVCATAKADYER